MSLKLIDVFQINVVRFQDDSGSIVKSWTNKSAIHGVFSGKTQLKEDGSNEGQWKLSVEYRGNVRFFCSFVFSF